VPSINGGNVLLISPSRTTILGRRVSGRRFIINLEDTSEDPELGGVSHERIRVISIPNNPDEPPRPISSTA
jgi:hypothetical protein